MGRLPVNGSVGGRREGREKRRERERVREREREGGEEGGREQRDSSRVRTREERVGYGFESVKMRGRQPLVKEKYINSKAR